MNLRRVILVSGIVAALCALLVLPAQWIYQVVNYAKEQRRAADVVESLVDRRPSGTSSTEWDVASEWAVTAYHNVCFSADHVRLDELRRFRVDVEAKCSPQAEIRITTIDWIWQRLAETGPHGKQYVGRFRPQYLEHLAAAQKQRQ